MSIKVLYVEDNEMNRDALSRLLKRKGFEVVMALDGEEGVRMAHSEAPALILLDISLPILDGYAVARSLRNDPSTASIPIIGLSAHAMSGDAEKAIEAGCDDYDTKPVEMPRLLSKMQVLLTKSVAKVD